MLFVQCVCPCCFRLDGFLCQWELKKSNNALAKQLLRDRAEWSLTMPPPTGRQMALAQKKKSLNLLFEFKSDAAYISTGVSPQVFSEEFSTEEQRGCKAL